MGRKRKSQPDAVHVQHRGSGWLPPPPIIIFDLPPVVFETTEQAFKDKVQLHTGSPGTQAAAAARLGCDVPPRKPRYGRRPSPPRPPPPADAIPDDPSLATAIVPFEVAAGGCNSQEDSSYVPPDLSPQGVAPFRRNEEGHLAAARPYATTSTPVFSMNADGGVPTASADAVSPSSSFQHNQQILLAAGGQNSTQQYYSYVPPDQSLPAAVPSQHNQQLLLAAGGQNSTEQYYYSYVPPDPSLSAAVPFQHNEQLLLAAGGQNSTEQYYSYVPSDPSLPAAVPFQHNQQLLLAAGDQNTQQYYSYVPFQHNENGHLAAAMPHAASASFVSDHHATTSTAVFPRVSNGGVPAASAEALSASPSSSIIFMSDGDLGNSAASAGAAVRVFNGNVFAGALATRPSSQAKLATCNSHANVVQQFLEEDNDDDWKWIFNRLL